MKGAIHGGVIVPDIGYDGYFDFTFSSGVSGGSTKPYYDGDTHVDMSNCPFIIDTSVLPLNSSAPIQIATIPSVLAPRFNFTTFAYAGITLFGTTNFIVFPVEVTNGGIIRVRRALVANTTDSTTNGPVYSHLSLSSETVTLYLPNIQWELR